MQSQNLLEVIHSGGPIMYAIVFFGIVAIFIFIEKWFYFHREQINTGELMKGLINVLQREGYVEANTLCTANPGPVSRMLARAMQSYENGDTLDEIKKAMENTAMTEIPRLEKFMRLLSSITYIAPLLGLLGTVLGMMAAFEEVSVRAGALVASDLASAIGMALITTAGGLLVAIPCYLGYHYLLSRIDAIVFDMEKAASEILTFFTNKRKESAEE